MPPAGVTPQLQRVVDALAYSPAIVRTGAWDVVAWNRAAAAVLTDYGALPPAERNILRIFFCDLRVRAELVDWAREAQLVVAAFRADAARAGESARIASLVDELRRSSPDFDAIWRAHDVRPYGEGAKHFRHPIAGPIALEYSAIAVDGRPDLGLVIYTPATPADRDRIRSLTAAHTPG